MSVCGCIARVNKMLSQKGLNTRVKQVIRFDGDGAPSDSDAMVFTEVDTPKRGARPAALFASFCPFCGTAYEKPAPMTEAV